MMNELSKRSWIQIRIRILMKTLSALPMAETYLPIKFEDDISKTVACREVTDKQTNKQTDKQTNKQTSEPTYLRRFRK